MPRQSYAFRVGAIAPTHDPAWHSAGESVHRAFHGAVVQFVIEEKNRELALGLDIFGEPLVPIAESTRQKGRWRSYTGRGTADNPPLTPAGALSRTRSLFTGRAHADHAEFFWRYDPISGQHWGRILGFHRAGAGYLPERDVIGLSPQSLANVERKARQWWADWKAGRAAGARAAELRVVLPPPPSGRPLVVRPVAGAHFDLDRFTFGIGGSRESAAARIAAGTSTGFRQRHASGPSGGTRAPGPGPAAPPRPAARPVPAPRPAAAASVPMPPRPKPQRPAARPKPAAAVAQLPSFGPSGATVRIANRREVLATLERITGRNATARDIANLVGAAADATVEAEPYSAGGISVEVHSPRYYASRKFRDEGGVKYIYNSYWQVNRQFQGQGLAREVFGRQVEHAAALGFQEIRTFGVRGEDFNGYYTWVRFGYDGPIPESVRRNLPAEWSSLTRVSDLMTSEEKRQWWRSNGDSVNLTFDLRPGSRSRLTWAAYVAEKTPQTSPAPGT